MKRLNLFLGAMALAAVALTASPEAGAQENGNRDENGKVVRGPYETNRFGDNWFIGSGGGINAFMNDGYKVKVGPSLDVSVGKWFTPSVGMRVGYSGISARSWADEASVLGPALDSDKNMYLQKFGYMYFHGDFLWNMSNGMGGYKETRFWNVIPYVHAGFFRAYGLDKAEFDNNELALGTGMLHNLRITERLDLVIDMKAIVVNGRVHGGDGVALMPSVTMGMAMDLGWPDFLRTSTVIAAVESATAAEIVALEAAALALEAANDALEGENADLQNANSRLSGQLKNMKPAPAQNDPMDILADLSPVTVYFGIGKSVLSVDELKHMDYIARNILSKVDELGKVYITVMGSADSNTGSKKRNENLSAERGKYIAEILTGKYGIPQDRIVVNSEVVKAQTDPELERAVKISF